MAGGITVQELFARLGVDLDQSSFARADKQLQGVAGTAGKVAGYVKAALGAAVAAFSVHKIMGVVEQVRGLGDSIDKMSISLGVGREALQEWEYAAGLGGVSSSELQMSLRMVQRSAAEAADGMATYKDEFDRMGISVKDGSGKLKSADVLLTEMADGLGRLETDTQRVATAQALLGRSGAKLLPLFAGGSAGVAAMRKEAHELGGVLGDDVINRAVELTDDIWRVEFAMRGVKATIFNLVGPAVVWFNKHLSNSVAILNGSKEASRGTKVAMWALAGALGAAVAALVALSAGSITGLLVKMGQLTAAGWAALAPYLPMAAAIAAVAAVAAALALVGEDLYVMFTGGKSAIGAFLDKVFGLGATQELVDNVRAGWAYFGEVATSSMDAAAEAFTRLSDTISASWKDTKATFAEWGKAIAALAPDWLVSAWDTAIKKLDHIISRGAELIQRIPFVQDVMGWLRTTEQSEELRRRQSQRAKGRGLGSETFEGPSSGRADAGYGYARRFKEAAELKAIRDSVKTIPVAVAPTVAGALTHNTRSVTRHVTIHQTVNARSNDPRGIAREGKQALEGLLEEVETSVPIGEAE